MDVIIYVATVIAEESCRSFKGQHDRGNTTRNSEGKMALWEGLWEGLWRISENL